MKQDSHNGSLLILDSALTLGAFGSAFGNDGYAIHPFSSPDEALEFLKSHQVNVILTGMYGPELNGSDFLPKAARLLPSATRILLAPPGDKEIALEAVAKGLVHHTVTKPWKDESFRSLIANLLGINRKVTEENLSRELNTLRNLPAPPACSERMNELLGGEYPLGDLANEIEKNPALVVRILKIANSVHFATHTPTRTVRDAIFLIGVERIAALVMGMEAFDAAAGTIGQEQLDIVGQIWERSLRRSVLARRIADATIGFRDHHIAHLSALLLDIGHVLRICSRYDEYRSSLRLVDECGVAPYEAERRTFGVTHDHLGRMLLDYWSIPAQIGEVVARHHDTPAGDQLLQIIQIADLLEGNGASSGPHDPALLPVVEQWRAKLSPATAMPGADGDQQPGPGVFVPNRKVLLVDDEENILRMFRSLMRKEPVEVHTLNDSRRIADFCTEHGPFALVLSDQRMPDLDGVAVLEHVASRWPETVRVIVTGYSDPKDTVRAINNAGIRHFINKPWDDAELKRHIGDWVARYNLEKEKSFLVDELKQKNESLNELLNGTIAHTARILSDMVAHVNPEGAAQTERIRKVGTALLASMTLFSDRQRWEIRLAIDLFNLGLVLLPAGVQMTLHKEGLRAADRVPEWQNHHLLAAELLKDIPQFEEVSGIIRFLRKDYNGRGVPEEAGVKGEQIPPGARFLRILIDLDRQNTEKLHGRKVLEKMAGMPEIYDVALIQQILGGVAPGNVSSQEHELTIEAMLPGMVLVEDLVSNRGELLLRAETTLTKTSIMILRQWQANDPVRRLFKVRGTARLME